MSSGADAVSAALREPARIAGKHGADRNLAVLHRHRAPHRAGHECRISIPPMATLVYVVSVGQSRLTQYQPGCFCARVAAPRRSSVAAVIVVRSTAPESARGRPGAGRNRRPGAATKRAVPAGLPMPPGSAAGGHGKRRGSYRVSSASCSSRHCLGVRRESPVVQPLRC